MITTLLRSRRVATCLTALTSVAALTMLPSTRAAVIGVAPSTVVSGDTFGIELVAYNNTNISGNFYAIAPTLAPTFGTTTSYANSALPTTPGGTNYQTLTVSSSESANNGIFTDTISISVPTNFIPVGTKDNNGNIVNALVFSVGLISNTGGTNPVDFTTPISLLSVTGAAVYSGNAIGLTQNPVLTNGNASFSDQEGVQSASSTTDIANSDVTSLSISLTYQAVPEPSTTGAVLLGAAGLVGFMALRRRPARA